MTEATLRIANKYFLSQLDSVRRASTEYYSAAIRLYLEVEALQQGVETTEPLLNAISNEQFAWHNMARARANMDNARRDLATTLRPGSQ